MSSDPFFGLGMRARPALRKQRKIARWNPCRPDRKPDRNSQETVHVRLHVGYFAPVRIPTRCKGRCDSLSRSTGEFLIARRFCLAAIVSGRQCFPLFPATVLCCRVVCRLFQFLHDQPMRPAVPPDHEPVPLTHTSDK